MGGGRRLLNMEVTQTHRSDSRARVIDGPVDPQPLTFEAFFREQSLGLVRLALLLVGGEQTAEDVTQDVLVELYRRWDHFSGCGQALAYARTSVTNRSRSVWRRRRVARIHAPVFAPELSEGSSDCLGADSVAVRRRWVLDALLALPPREREVLVLRYWLDLSEAQIAETLHISVATVKSTSARTLAKLAYGMAEEKSP